MKASSLTPLDDALQLLLARAVPLRQSETVDLLQADGRVLAQDVHSALSVPAWDNSAMDGYALRCADVPEAGAVLPVTHTIAAGQAAAPLQPGAAARIFTGAPVPDGADAVVMQEDCETLADDAVRIHLQPRDGQNIRRAGEDIRSGSVILHAGTRLRPAALGLMASVGHAQAQVVRRPRVALFSSGDELVAPGSMPAASLPPGAIFNSSRYFLLPLLQRLGCEVPVSDNLPDDPQSTTQMVRMAARQCDVVLCTGGVSMGGRDFVRDAVQALGTLELWKLAIKPGKPFAWGRLQGEAPRADGADAVHFMGLPGNPVSSLVTFLLLVRPFLLAMQGVPQATASGCMLPAAFDWPKPGKRREFLRARRNASGALELFPNQSSGVLTSTVWGEGLVDIAPSQTVSRGDPVRFLSFLELDA